MPMNKGVVMIVIDRELFKQLAAGRFATLNQTYSKQDAESFQDGALWAYDLLMKSLNKVDIKPIDDKKPIEELTIVQ